MHNKWRTISVSVSPAAKTTKNHFDYDILGYVDREGGMKSSVNFKTFLGLS